MRHQPQLQLPVTTAHPSSAQLSVGVCWQALHMPHILRSWKSSPQGHFQDAATGLVKSKLKLHKTCLQWFAYGEHTGNSHRQTITQPKVLIYFVMPSSVYGLWLSPLLCPVACFYSQLQSRYARNASLIFAHILLNSGVDTP